MVQVNADLTLDLVEELLTHQLRPYFPALARCNSTEELFASELYRQLKPEIERVLKGAEYRRLPVNGLAVRPFYRAVAWNVERGICFESILETLQKNDTLNKADVLLLTETDLGMARSKNRNVALLFSGENKN